MPTELIKLTLAFRDLSDKPEGDDEIVSTPDLDEESDDEDEDAVDGTDEEEEADDNGDGTLDQ